MNGKPLMSTDGSLVRFSSVRIRLEIWYSAAAATPKSAATSTATTTMTMIRSLRTPLLTPRVHLSSAFTAWLSRSCQYDRIYRSAPLV